MIETKEQYEEIMRHTPFYEGGETGAVRETIEALRKAVKQAPKIIKRESGINPCAFCWAYPADDHYAHCAYAALPDWLKEDG